MALDHATRSRPGARLAASVVATSAGACAAASRFGTAAARLGLAFSRAGTDAARAVCTPRGAAGLAVEALWCTAHLAVYPSGLPRERADDDPALGLEGLAPLQRGLVIGDVEAAGTPILLVHGMVDNRSVFTVLRRGLRRRGFGRVLTMNYSPVANDVRATARVLAEEIEALVSETGYERLHVVGHSLGGLVARYYVQRLGGDERIDTLVTLGTPHGGTLPAYLLPAGLGRQLRPGSDLLTELAEPAPGCRTRFISYWSDLDQMVVPQRNGRLLHPDLMVHNVLVRGVGHMSLPIDARIGREISGVLSQLDPGGQGVVTGISRGRQGRQAGGRRVERGDGGGRASKPS